MPKLPIGRWPHTIVYAVVAFVWGMMVRFTNLLLNKLAGEVDVPRVVIIGNALTVTSGPLQPEIKASRLSRFIDSCDVVIRMNNIKNINSPGIGTRTDMLAMMNTGLPGNNYATGKTLRSSILSNLREVIFVVPPNEMKSLLNITDDPAAGRDFSAEILVHQGWTDLKVSFVNGAVIERLETSIAEFAGRKFMGSTGARTIAHVLYDRRFAGFDIYIAGFGFEGFDFHCIAAERRICENLIAAGKLRIVSNAQVAPFYAIYCCGRRLRKLLNSCSVAIRKL